MNEIIHAVNKQARLTELLCVETDAMKWDHELHWLTDDARALNNA